MIDNLKEILIDLSEPDEQDEIIVEEITKLLSRFKEVEEQHFKKIEEQIISGLHGKADIESINQIHQKIEDYILKTKDRNDKKISEVRDLIKLSDEKIEEYCSLSAENIKSLKLDITDSVKGIEKTYSILKKELMETLSDAIRDTKLSEKSTSYLLKNLKKEMEDSIKNEIVFLSKKLGGGSMPPQISVNGTVANVRYADINYISSGASVATNNTTHKTDITFTGGSAGTWYQDEIVATGLTGTSFSLQNIPTSIVFLFLNGQYLVSGVGYDYTRSGKNITLTNALISSDILTANYS